MKRYASVLLVLAISISGMAMGGHQENWQPNRYQVECKNAACLPTTLHRQLEQLMTIAVDKVRGMGFDAPRNWGERVGAGTPSDHVRLYDLSAINDTIAATGPKCKSSKGRAAMIVGAGVREKVDRPSLLFYFLAHELFHLIQYGYPSFDEAGCRAPPGWISESTATAVGFAAMRKRYPGVQPPLRNDLERRMWTGLRRYSEPLPARYADKAGKEITTGSRIYYHTASFWRHVADVFHRGGYTFLQDYLKRKGRNGDWVRWLRENIESDTGTHLGVVFAGFLADYAGWGDQGMHGAMFGRATWLQGAFGGCKTVELSRENAAASIELSLLPLSGACVRVKVSGLHHDDSAAVQVAATVDPERPSAREALHLGLVASNDKARFHCARLARRQGRRGIGRCVLVPDDGRIRLHGADTEARVWNVIAQRPGEPQARRQHARRGRGLENLYTISYTPLAVSSDDTRHGGSNPISAKLYFVLDVADWETDDGASEPTKKSDRRVTARLGQTPLADPQTTLPKTGQNASPGPAFGLAAPIMPMPGQAAGMAGVTGKLTTLVISRDLWNGNGDVGDRSTLVLLPVRKRGKRHEPRPLGVGETGTFDLAVMSANLAGKPAAAMSVGSLQVEEFSDEVLRARYRVTLCRLSDIRGKRCANPVPISGTVTKAFAGSRLPGRHMLVQDTPGSRLYRSGFQYTTPVAPPAPRPEEPGPRPRPPTPPPVATPKPVNGCDCGCAAFEEFQVLSKGLKRGEMPSPELMEKLQPMAKCAPVCGQQWVTSCGQRR